MPRRYEDDDDDDRPRRRPRDDDDADDDDRPRGRRRSEEDDDGPPTRRTKKKSNLGLILGILGGVLLLCCGGGGFAAWYFGDQVVGEARDRQKSATNLKQVGIGIHNYSDTHNFMPNNSYGPDGRPLLSWRVHILPYVEQEALYRRFNLSEPWDGPTNRQLISQMPAIYTTPQLSKRSGPGLTYYRGFSHKGAIFERPGQPGVAPGGNKLNIARIADGLSNTIFVVEAGDPVEWTRPDDLDFGPGRPLPALGGGRKADVVAVLMGDGSIRFVRLGQPESNWRAAISYNGGEVVYLD